VQIRIQKRGGRNLLRCIRADGSFTQADTGPGLPGHDLAHFAAESTLGLREGFYGLIATGYTIAELSDRNVIPQLPPGVWVAEVLARALGSLHTGACTLEQFAPLVQAELGDRAPALPDPLVRAIANRFAELMAAWHALPDGETLELAF